MCNTMQYYSNRSAKKILLEKQGLVCCYCECVLIDVDSTNMQYKDIPANQATVEHLKRKSDGGKNNLDNLALACIRCNMGRGDVDWLTYKCYKMGEITL